MRSGLFFTSDTHFGHENIIEYCNRPFVNAKQMDDELISSWNRVVEKDDIVYHLGDFTLGGEYAAKAYFRQLNGKIFVLGNIWHHDGRWLSAVNQLDDLGSPTVSGFAPFLSASHHQITVLPALHVLHFPEYGRDGYPKALILCHYPFAVWDRKHYGAWHLFGHSHGTHQNGGLSFDVGVDCNQFQPVSLEGVCRQMKAYGDDVKC
jgi:calcineurin-like phosphoesterase family protein